MSHTDDVINQDLNGAFQIHKKMRIFKKDEYFEFQTFDPSYWSEWPDRYFLCFSKTLQEGQEIHHGLKMFKNENRKSPRIKRLDFLFDVLLSKLPRTIFFSFFEFRVTWPIYQVRKKSSYRFGNHFSRIYPKAWHVIYHLQAFFTLISKM